MEGSARLVRLVARDRTAIVRTPRNLDPVRPARQVVLTDYGVEELQLEEIGAELLRHGGQMAPVFLDVHHHHFNVQRRGGVGFVPPPRPPPPGGEFLSCGVGGARTRGSVSAVVAVAPVRAPPAPPR